MSDYDEIIALRAEMQDLRFIVGGESIKLDKDKKPTTQTREDVAELKGYKQKFSEELDSLKHRIEELSNGLAEVKGQLAAGIVSSETDVAAATAEVDNLTSKLKETTDNLNAVIDEKGKGKNK